MNLTESARAVCPYYRTAHDQTIQCESCVRKARLIFAFANKGARARHSRDFCDTMRWQDCLYARMLNNIYDEEDE